MYQSGSANGWEYRQETLDFHNLHAVQNGQQVVISSIRFSYFNYVDKNNLNQAKTRGNAMIERVVLDYANRLGKEGWELVSFQAATSDGRNYPSWPLYLMSLTLIGVPIALIINYTFPQDFIRYDYATLVFRRRR